LRSTRWESAQKPRLPAPDPDPPTSDEAALIVAAAWAEDDDWGPLVWMLLVTGARRGEVLALCWENRRMSLDAVTVALLSEHRQQLIVRCAELGARFDDQLFLFSYQPGHSQPCSPSGVTHRNARVVGRLGIRTRLHAGEGFRSGDEGAASQHRQR
jgi:integrase